MDAPSMAPNGVAPSRRASSGSSHGRGDAPKEAATPNADPQWSEVLGAHRKRQQRLVLICSIILKMQVIFERNALLFGQLVGCISGRCTVALRFCCYCLK